MDKTYPTKEQCYRMIRDMGMMEHIVIHSLQVCRVATFLTRHLIKQKHPLNFELIRSSALLHDITKTRSFITREDHAKTGAVYLTECGYPEIGELIRQHVVLDGYSVDGQITEGEVLNYADKRVLHDRIVALDKRQDYIVETYAETEAHRQRIYALWEKTREMENKIFKDLSFAPDDLSRRIPHNGYSNDFRKYLQLLETSPSVE